MISLKKNDKIIIIVAFIILIIAGVAIATYQSPETKNILPSTITSEDNFNIIWSVQNGTLDTISDFANKKSKFGTTEMIDKGNVKSITFNLSWTDDRMTFLKRMGLDRLTLEVTTPDGRTISETNTSAPITGDGTISLCIATDIIPPESSFNSVKANNEKDALAKLQLPPYNQDGWSGKEIKINVSVQIGEIRLLKKIRDKGNDFELKITYQYYDGTLVEDTTKNTGGDTGFPPEDDIAELVPPPYMSMIINTGCGRYV